MNEIDSKATQNGPEKKKKQKAKRDGEIDMIAFECNLVLIFGEGGTRVFQRRCMYIDVALIWGDVGNDDDDLVRICLFSRWVKIMEIWLLVFWFWLDCGIF